MRGDLPPSDADVAGDLPDATDPDVVEGMQRLAELRAREPDVIEFRGR